MHENNPVEKLFAGRLKVEAAFSQYYFSRSSVMQSVIHQLKYRGNSGAGIEMGKLMGHSIKHSPRFCNIDYIIPLPLFPEKELARGYNQAEVLSRGIEEITEIPVLKNVVIRNKATSTQTRKNRMERWQNVNEVFSVTDPLILQGKKLLLTDDVITTGATLEACGHAVRAAGGSQIYVASLAFAMQ